MREMYFSEIMGTLWKQGVGLEVEIEDYSVDQKNAQIRGYIDGSRAVIV